MSDILILKTTEGDEIISMITEKLDEEGERQWVLLRPQLVVGKNVLPLKSPRVKVRIDHTHYPLTPTEELRQQYFERLKNANTNQSRPPCYSNAN